MRLRTNGSTSNSISPHCSWGCILPSYGGKEIQPPMTIGDDWKVDWVVNLELQFGYFFPKRADTNAPSAPHLWTSIQNTWTPQPEAGSLHQPGDGKPFSFCQEPCYLSLRSSTSIKMPLSLRPWKSCLENVSRQNESWILKRYQLVLLYLITSYSNLFLL